MNSFNPLMNISAGSPIADARTQHKALSSRTIDGRKIQDFQARGHSRTTPSFREIKMKISELTGSP